MVEKFWPQDVLKVESVYQHRSQICDLFTFKEKYKNNPNIYYREATVVDSNRNDELAIIKHQSSGKFTVKNYARQKRTYNAYIKTKDDEGKPIKIGPKFKRANPKYDVTRNNANKMKKQSVKSKNKQIATDNQNALKALKGRKK